MNRMNRIVLALALCGSTSSASCAPAWDNWGWGFAPSTDKAVSYGSFGVRPEALDNFDEADIPTWDEPGPLVGVYKEPGVEGWDGPAGFYASDMRSSLPAVVGAQRSWLFRTWIDSRVEEEVPWFTLAWASPFGAPAGVCVTITLLDKPVGIAGGPALGTAWDLSASPFGGVQLPPFKTSDGRQGYLFEVTATVVPEPSSLLALTGGMGLLSGLMRRRKG